MHDYTPAARFYWWICALFGSYLLAVSLAHVAGLPAAAIWQIALAAAFAAAAGFFPVEIPGTKLSVAGGEIFIFLTLLLHGVDAAIVVACAEGLVGALRTSNRWTSWAGTPAMAAISVFAAGSAFVWSSNALKSAGVEDVTVAVLLFTAFALAYCVLTNFFPSLLISLKRSQRLNVRALIMDRAWMAVANVSSAAIAGLLFFAGLEFGIPVLFAAAPSIVLSMSSAHFHFQRTVAERTSQAALVEAANENSRRAQAHAAELQRSEARFHAAFTNAAIGMALVSVRGEFRLVNPAVCKLLDDENLVATGRSFADFMHPSEYKRLLAELSAISDSHEPASQIELQCHDRDSTPISVALSVSYFGDAPDGPELIVQLQDIRERKQAEARLKQMAFNDALTGLPNRVYFREQLARAIGRAQRDATFKYALMFLDFDRFKSVNDSLGHGAGDALLIEFASRIRGVVRSIDTVARLGGDEFAVLVEQFGDDPDALELAQRILDTFATPFVVEGTQITSSASIGIAFGAPRYSFPDELIRDADLAMYKSKAMGRARYAVFDSSLHDIASTHMQTENELRNALERGEFRIHYQPQFNLEDRALCGYEALVRWAHPKRGLLYPDTFLPVAVETGLVVPIGRFVIEQACLQLGHWRENAQGKFLRLAINVSEREIRADDFVDHLVSQLCANDIPPMHLILELCERTLSDAERLGNKGLARLREAGVSINVDGFGTGFSSLGQFTQLQFDGISLNRSFVQQSVESREAMEIVRAITSMGRALGKRVHASGIETEAQWRAMQDLGCDSGQGNLCSPPVSADEIVALMSESRLIRATH
jgi:diguanylate cyclase (GGDEF)-like protein/PAS domain S-box-containing protein